MTHALTGVGVLLLDLFTSKFLLFPILFVAIYLKIPNPPIYLATNAVTRCAWSCTVGFEGEWISFESYFRQHFDGGTSYGISPEEPEKALGERGLVANPAALTGDSKPGA